eukprot:12440259-Ditylum_brightwellii.AAC.1
MVVAASTRLAGWWWSPQIMALKKVRLTIGNKLGKKSSTEEEDAVDDDDPSLLPLPKCQKSGWMTRHFLIVGGAGGVGSWTTLLSCTAYPDLGIVSTTSTNESAE